MTRHYDKAEEILAQLEADGFNPLERYKVAYSMQLLVNQYHKYGLIIAAIEEDKKEEKDESTEKTG